MRFHRVNGKYDVRQLTHSRGRLIPFELVGGSNSLFDGKTLWLNYAISDSDSDGVPGISLLHFNSKLNTQLNLPTTQPAAPRWEELTERPRGV